MSSATMEIKIRTALRFCLTPVRMITSREQMITNEEETGNPERLYPSG